MHYSPVAGLLVALGLLVLTLQVDASGPDASGYPAQQASASADAEQASPGGGERQYQLSAATQARLLAQMIWVEGGSFTMGSDADDATSSEKPAHTVTVDGFYIGKTEVTQDLFEELMGWNTSYFVCPRCPMNNISWLNMQLFIDRLNKVTGKRFRFPTEAEWEYAARGGNRSGGYLYSGSNAIDQVAWYAGNSQRRSHPVAQKGPNELGLYDMTGNMWEFCLDDMYPNIYGSRVRSSAGAPVVNPLELSADGDSRRIVMKVQRGGGYEFEPGESEVYRRDGATSNVRMPDIGFRLVMEK